MRCLIIATVSVFALTPGAFAQTFPPSSLRAGLTQDDIVRQHPNWFTEEPARLPRFA